MWPSPRAALRVSAASQRLRLWVCSNWAGRRCTARGSHLPAPTRSFHFQFASPAGHARSLMAHPRPPRPPARPPAVEVDGPVHFATNSRHLMGGTALKRRLLQVGGRGRACRPAAALRRAWLRCTACCHPPTSPTPLSPPHCLQRLGWRVVAVPFFDWWQLAPGQRQRYMRAKLSAAGLDPSTFAQAAPAPPVPAPAAAAVVETEQQRQQEQPHASEPALQQPAIAGESAAAVQQGDGGGSAATPAGLAQRAQRLSLLQHRQGKLSRQGLLTKTARSALAASGPTGKAGSDGSGASNVGSEAAPGSGGAAEHEGSGGAPAS